MNELLAIEWLKIKRYRTFWVLAGLFIVLLPLWNYEVANGFLKFGGNGKNGINFLSTAYAFPQVWGNVGFWGSLFINFLSILIIIMTTNEYHAFDRVYLSGIVEHRLNFINKGRQDYLTKKSI